MDDVVQTFQRLIASEYLNMAPEDLPLNHPLVSNGLIDSFNLVDLALHVEEESRVHIEDTEQNASVFDAIDPMAALIRSRR